MTHIDKPSATQNETGLMSLSCDIMCGSALWAGLPFRHQTTIISEKCARDIHIALLEEMGSLKSRIVKSADCDHEAELMQRFLDLNTLRKQFDTALGD